MNSLKAKEILSSYRPGKDDAEDTVVAEALAHMRGDPELQAWHEQQQVLDDLMRARVQGIDVPPDLRERILSAPRRESRPVKSWKTARLPRLLAIAATLVMAAGLWLAIAYRPGLDAYRQSMVRQITGEHDLDVETEDLGAVRLAFAELGWPSDYEVPSGFDVLEVEGGKAMKWRGRRVSVLCLESEDDAYVWLFVVNRSELSNAPETESPRIQKVGELMTASWSRGENTYLLTVEGDEGFLRRCM